MFNNPQRFETGSSLACGPEATRSPAIWRLDINDQSTQPPVPHTTLIAPGDLLIDPELQVRSHIDKEHIERLARTDPKDWPPLVVTPVPNRAGKYAVIDGAHRLLAGQRIELPDGRTGRVKQYRCVVVGDAGYVESFSLNADHPMSLSASDRKAFAHFLEKNYPSLSHREIARRCGLGRRTVDRLLSRSDDHIPSPPNHIKRFVGLLVKAYASGEASGFFGLGERRSGAIADAIRGSKSPGVAVKALTIWVEACREALGKIQKQSPGKKDRKS